MRQQLCESLLLSLIDAAFRILFAHCVRIGSVRLLVSA
jgi:hypothetical protein